MTPFVVALGVVGVILVLVGLVGGGFKISTTEMPKVGNWVRLPCFGIGVCMVLAAIGLGIRSNSNTPTVVSTISSTAPAAATSPAAPTNTGNSIATGIIQVPPGYSTVYVYNQPSSSSSVVAEVANGTTIGILCTSQGDIVTNSETGQSSSLWDGTSDGYIPDVYVNTGTNQATMTNC